MKLIVAEMKTVIVMPHPALARAAASGACGEGPAVSQRASLTLQLERLGAGRGFWHLRLLVAQPGSELEPGSTR